MGMMADATQRRGQDIGSDTSRFIAQLGASVDREKIAQAGAQFQQDLILRLKALEQAERQWGAAYGLDLTRLEMQADDSAWNRAFGAA
jgi:hypothetical protein